jgi:L-aminopeptidase/D-esterase-like protein
MRNLITDVPGVLVGNAADVGVGSGATTVIFEEPVVASSLVIGRASAGYDLGSQDLEATQDYVDAVVLSGGAVYGRDAAAGVRAWLREQGRGTAIRSVRVPIVWGASCSDLHNGGNKHWDRYSPYRELGYTAAGTAGAHFALGTTGGGYGATTFDLKGGLGSASVVTSSGFVVAALVVVNPIGSAVVAGGPHFWAAPFEEDNEFGGLRFPPRINTKQSRPQWKPGPDLGSTLAVVATDATLDKEGCRKMAVSAYGGLAKAMTLAHALMDGDTVFAAATARKPLVNPMTDIIELCAASSSCLARAVARGVYEATALPYPNSPVSWRDVFDKRSSP